MLYNRISYSYSTGTINVFLLLLGFMVPRHALSQGLAADYARAEMIKAKLTHQILYAPQAFYWLPGEYRFWYAHHTENGKEFVVVNALTLSKNAAFDHMELASQLSAISGIKTAPYQLPFDEINYIDTNTAIAFEAYHQNWVFDLATNVLTTQVKRGATASISADTVTSPDGNWHAFIRNSNVYLSSATDDDAVFQLSFDGSPGEYYSAAIQWSPDSKKLATYKIRPAEPRTVYLIESSPEDQLQPKLHARNYRKPGDALPQYTPALFLVDERQQVNVRGVPVTEQFRLSPIVWRKDSRAFTFEYNQRGHQRYEIIAVDAASGTMKTIVQETSSTFIDYRGKHYRYDIKDGTEIIWASERDGWNHLYLYDGKTGTVKNQITQGPWVVRDVIRVNEADRTILFTASGREKNQDPYLIHYYRINFDGTGLVDLTPENANHIAFFSADFSYFIDTYSRVDVPPTAVLRRISDGKVLATLEQADIGGLTEAGWHPPEVYHAKGRDGMTDIWGIIVRPTNFDPSKKYPVIEYIYSGPHDSFVPKSFISEPSPGDYRPWTALSELAELGFIVVQIDGMGTSNRSKAFHDVCWKNLKDAGFPDRIAWIKSAARHYPSMDTTRVGIYGNSAGGQSSVAALLFHPDFYKVAVSSSGCHDNRMDKLGWNELWMGYPIGPQYEASSNVTNAYRLRGRLLLILGEMDTNVPPESTLQLVDALIKSKKEFDFLMVPGMGHSLGGTYGEHKRRDFFVKHLLGKTPPVWKGMNSSIINN